MAETSTGRINTYIRKASGKDNWGWLEKHRSFFSCVLKPPPGSIFPKSSQNNDLNLRVYAPPPSPPDPKI